MVRVVTPPPNHSPPTSANEMCSALVAERGDQGSRSRTARRDDATSRTETVRPTEFTEATSNRVLAERVNGTLRVKVPADGWERAEAATTTERPSFDPR